jgi:acetolactate synthase-1/2/3 large subunit
MGGAAGAIAGLVLGKTTKSAAIGAALARPDLSTVLISGDGSFQLNLQELETVRRNNLNLKILLFNNHCHGMVRQFQESYFKDNLQSTVKGYSAPNFTALAQAYGIQAWSASDPASANIAIEQWIETDGPTLLELHLSQASKVYPKLAFGRRFGEMEPDITPIAMEST